MSDTNEDEGIVMVCSKTNITMDGDVVTVNMVNEIVAKLNFF